MWRNVSWNSTEPANLPEGMHKHETGAYFKTPSIQSGTSSQSGGVIPTAATVHSNSTESITGGPANRSVTPTEEITEEPSMSSEPAATLSGRAQPEQQQPKRTRLRDSGRQPSVAKSAGSNRQPGTGTGGQAGFRSRLSSISGALQHPKLAKRLFSHHQDSVEHQAPIQITTTSIDSPQHGPANEESHSARWQEQLEPRLMSSSSGRRLSQLFLPQLNNPMLSADPYASNELIPPHLLGLYGQPPLVGGAAGSPSAAALSAHRASWADISLLGRLSNVRPSIDSAFHSGQVRHSFDARKYKPDLVLSCLVSAKTNKTLLYICYCYSCFLSCSNLELGTWNLKLA